MYINVHYKTDHCQTHLVICSDIKSYAVQGICSNFNLGAVAF